MLALPSGAFLNVLGLSYQEEASICHVLVYIEHSHVIENNFLRCYRSLYWLFSFPSFFPSNRVYEAGTAPLYYGCSWLEVRSLGILED